MSEISIIMRLHELYKDMAKITEGLPTLKKQTMGKRLEDSILQLLELCIMAKHRLTRTKHRIW